MECQDKNGQTVIPIFYDVDPSHVRHQRESFAKAFAEHESKYKDDVEGMQKVQAWRTALNEAANLKGCDTRDRIESECIRDLVDQISSRLRETSLSYLQNVVGIDTHIEEVNSLLEMEIDDVRIVGIWGMGGVGKTTVARAIFDTLLYQFEAACFLADIKENKCGMHSLQNILLSELLRKKDNYVNNKDDGKHLMAHRLCSKKVLVVLDDIDHRDYLDYLAGDLGWFGKGSRIIATTRDKHLIENDDAIYEVPLLPDHEAVELFNQHAFKQNNGVPSEECFKKLSLEVVNHAKGLPLALKVWGSLLHKKSLTQWRRTVDQIKKNSSSDIAKKLRISYDGLEPKQQKIFLDMACFLRGVGKALVIQILDSCDVEAEYGLDVLIEKSLVFLSKDDKIEMHDLVQDMGKYIVTMQREAGKCSRIWDSKDFEEVMATDTKAMEAIWFDEVSELCFSKEAMKNMKNMKKLRILLIGSTLFDNCITCHDDSIEYLSNNLRWVSWPFYSWKSLPVNFEPKRLVHLDLRWSSLHHLLNEIKHLSSLRYLDLSRSKNLMRTPDFTRMRNLEYLYVEYCRSLEEVHHSLGYCRKLIKLNLNGCRSLKRFPCVSVQSLEYLDLRSCSSLEIFPEIVGRMKPVLEIYKESCGIREMPSSSFKYQTHITKLDLSSMENLVSLPSSIGMMKSLVELDVSECRKLESLPEEIGDLENLEKLLARDTLISQPPPSIARLNKLTFMCFSNRDTKWYFVFPQVNEGLRSLEYLNLSYCNLIDGGLPEDIGSLSSLTKLNLKGNNFEHLPQSIAQLGALQFLDLSYCERLTHLPEFPQNLNTINADWSSDSICNSLFQNISSLQHNISASDSLSLRVFSSKWEYIPDWFHHQGYGRSVSVILYENWYVSDNFLGFAVCYFGRLPETTAQLIPVCDDGMSSMTQKLAFSKHSELFYYSECDTEYYSAPVLHFVLVTLSSLWDTSKANGKTPNDYGRILLSFSSEGMFGFRLLYKEEMIGFRLLYKDEPEHRIMTRRSRYENSEHHDSVINETSEQHDAVTNKSSEHHDAVTSENSEHHDAVTNENSEHHDAVTNEISEHHDSVTNEASCSSQIVTFLTFVGTLCW